MASARPAGGGAGRGPLRGVAVQNGSVLRLLSQRPARTPNDGSDGPSDPLAALAATAACGDREAQRSLLVALGPSLLRVVRGVLGVEHPDVEDVLQQGMMAVHGALPAFRGECSVRHFASRIVVQTAMNARRRAGYRARYTPTMPPLELAELAQSDDSPAVTLAASRRREAVRQLLCELPAVQAEVLALHTMLGYSVDETAAAVGAPANTVRSRLRAALSALRARLQADGDLQRAVRGGG